MTPLQLFEAVWDRASVLTAIHAYMAKNATAVLQPEEILRAEWVARISALDLYVHELVAQRMLAIFAGKLPATPQYNKFRITVETGSRIRAASTDTEANAAFDLDVRQQLGIQSFQMPDKIADAVRYCSPIDLWNAVALKQGASEATKSTKAKETKTTLSVIAARRNKIAHEGDSQPGIPRLPWPIREEDLAIVRAFVEGLVRAIDACVLDADPKGVVP